MIASEHGYSKYVCSVVMMILCYLASLTFIILNYYRRKTFHLPIDSLFVSIGTHDHLFFLILFSFTLLLNLVQPLTNS